MFYKVYLIQLCAAMGELLSKLWPRHGMVDSDAPFKWRVGLAHSGRDRTSNHLSVRLSIQDLTF